MTYLLHMETSGLDSTRYGITYLGLYTLEGVLYREVHINLSETDTRVDPESFEYSMFTEEDMLNGVDVNTLSGLDKVNDMIDTILDNTIIGFNMVWMNGFLRELSGRYVSKNTLSIMEYHKWTKFKGLIDSVALNNLVSDEIASNKVEKQLYLIQEILREPVH